MAIPRGIRMNNPGNIRQTKIKWKGKIEPSADPSFEQFVSPEMGIRAIARDLLSGYKRGQDTVREIVTEWAPPVENNTRAYIGVVCEALNAAPDTVIDVDDYATMCKLAKAIIKHENGQQPYSDETIRAALFDAGVDGTPPAAKALSPEGIGAAIAATAGTSTGAIETAYDAIDKLEPLKATLMDLAPVLTVAKYALLALTVIGAGLVVYGFVQKFRKGLA